MKKRSEKDNIRQKISALKKQYTHQDLLFKSEEVFSILEITGAFQEAKHIFIYNSLKDEVSTKSFIERWAAEKHFYFPVIDGDDIVFRHYKSDTTYSVSSLGISEPDGENFTDYKKVDLIIIPGVAFDSKLNRLGRGKGYYDRFLPKLKATKIGVCFDFQLLDKVPVDNNDVKMDMLISENDLIW